MSSGNYSVFYSQRLRRNLADGSVGVPLGAAHYSYATVAQKFVRAWSAVGLTPNELLYPEIYRKKFSGYEDNYVHVIFKPFSEIRILHPAYNIGHIAWEFERLPTKSEWSLGDPRRRHPFCDYVHMLKIPDRVWVGCSFAKSVLNRYGIENVDVVPAPILFSDPSYRNFEDRSLGFRDYDRKKLGDLQGFGYTRALRRSTDVDALVEHQVRLADIIKNDTRVFLSVLNPGDIRKNLPALLDGFALAAHRCPAAVLFVKLTIDNIHVNLGHVLSQILPARYRELDVHIGELECRSIYFVVDFLDGDQLDGLYEASEFYITSTMAEGQNLPLQEAMSLGVIPVSPRHTAMKDYLTDDNSIAVASRAEVAPFAFEAAYGLAGCSIDCISADDVAAAVQTACELPRRKLTDLSDAAIDVMRKGYSATAISGETKKIFDAISW